MLEAHGFLATFALITADAIVDGPRVFFLDAQDLVLLNASLVLIVEVRMLMLLREGHDYLVVWLAPV